MANERSRQALLAFLDYEGDKGLMAKATVAARKAAVGKVLGILSTEEAEDVTKLDLDAVMRRFQNLQGKGYTPTSLTTYLGRLKAAVGDFRSYLENPLGFRPSVQTRERRSSTEKGEQSAPLASEPYASPERTVVKPPLSSSILPIPIRPDTTVFIQGLPYDLTEAEASKIANVVRAMATSS